MNTLLNSMTTTTYTENGALARNTTGTALVDAFGALGAKRGMNVDDYLPLFALAHKENPTLARKMAFWLRDARQGVGERETARTLFKWLAMRDDTFLKDVKFIPEFGRWDDLYALDELTDEGWKVIKKQFHQDMHDMAEGKPISLLAKWLKSCNTSSKESRALGRKTAGLLGLSEKAYRQQLSKMRKYLDVTEVKASSNNWGDINYPSVPSKAMKNYSNAFNKHDAGRFNQYLKDVASGTEKINSGVLMPYELVHDYTNNLYRRREIVIDERTELQWKALPNFAGDKNFLVMVDTSGSMWGQPLEVSTSLGIYFAERNTGAFADHFITFTDEPRFVYLDRNASLAERVSTVLDGEYVGFDTNLEAAFQLVLDSAVKDKVPAEDMPEAIVIISDMEINRFGEGEANTDFTTYMEQKFADAGYKAPKLIYWNVSARQNTFHANATDNVQFISGCSSAIFKNLCDGADLSAYGLMYNTLMGERYACIE